MRSAKATTSARTSRANLALEAELRRCVRVLVEQYKPLKILLFGSLAEGSPNEYSDIDLVVIKETSDRFLDRIGEVLQLLCPREPLDVLVYTPAEFEEMVQTRPFFRDEIVAKAKTLYDATQER